MLALKVTSSRNTLRALGSLGSFGFLMVASIAVGLVGGYYLDRLLGLENCFIIIGAFVGIVAGVVEFFRLVKVFLKDRDKDNE
ncbi:MAG: AtpZ/AtpI family protein [Candidatus Hydrogenedentota bacterium]|nr:MAG: AtpZ/AtpI family protein [Candidatus Hydrogenedentota bacterium]